MLVVGALALNGVRSTALVPPTQAVTATWVEMKTVTGKAHLGTAASKSKVNYLSLDKRTRFM